MAQIQLALGYTMLLRAEQDYVYYESVAKKVANNVCVQEDKENTIFGHRTTSLIDDSAYSIYFVGKKRHNTEKMGRLVNVYGFH